MKSPEQIWFDELPIYTEEAPIVGYSIFAGEVNGVRNLVVRITPGRQLNVIKGGDGDGHWRFDYNSGQFVLDMTSGSQWGYKITTMVGQGLTYNTTEDKADVTFDDVVSKLIPLT